MKSQNLTVTSLKKEHIPLIVNAFAAISYDKPATQFLDYITEQEQQLRTIWIAWSNEEFVGYITILWQSDYAYFRDNQIPEIKDLNILPTYRRQSIGNYLLEKAEETIFEKYAMAGLGVGLTADYMPALNLYLKQGYLPDNNGIAYQNKNLHYQDKIIIDDDLTLMFVKTKK